MSTKLTKAQVIKEVSQELDIPRSSFDMEKYFGDWYLTGKLATILLAKNTGATDLGTSVEFWKNRISKMVEDSNISCVKGALANTDWSQETIFEIH